MNIIRHALLALAVFVASTSVAQAQSKTPEAVIREIEELRGLVHANSKGKDRAAFQRLVTTDFAFVHSTGDVDDAETYLQFRERVVPDQSWEEEPPAYRIFADVVVRTRYGGNRVPGRGEDLYRGVDVYARENGQWRWAFHQTTRVPRKPSIVPVADDLLSEYTGRYVSVEGVAYRVSKEGGGLVLEGQHGKTSFKPQSESTFNASPLPVNVVFLRDTSGKVTLMEVHRREAATVFKRSTTQ